MLYKYKCNEKCNFYGNNQEKKKLLIGILDIIALIKMSQILSFIYFAKKYKWIINNFDLDVAKKLRLTSIKNY